MWVRFQSLHGRATPGKSDAELNESVWSDADRVPPTAKHHHWNKSNAVALQAHHHPSPCCPRLLPVMSNFEGLWKLGCDVALGHPRRSHQGGRRRGLERLRRGHPRHRLPHQHRNEARPGRRCHHQQHRMLCSMQWASQYEWRGRTGLIAENFAQPPAFISMGWACAVPDPTL